MRYLTDGNHLYEVVARRTVQNYGLRRGSIRYVIIRDCVSEATATIDDLQFAALSEVIWPQIAQIWMRPYVDLVQIRTCRRSGRSQGEWE